MSTLTIGEVARQTGVPAATLRYYDDLGLVVPPSRSDAGYRLYDEVSLQRLRFIGRAKELDCTLDEIADLLVAWDGGECGPVQERLRGLVDDKIAASQQRLLDITVLAAELQRAAAQLGRHQPTGPCDEQCACTSDPDGPEAQEGGGGSVVPSDVPSPVTFIGGPEIACSLQPEAMPDRLAMFQDLLTKVTRRESVDRGVRLSLTECDPGEVAALITAEQQCCAFWEFALTIDQRGIGLEVRGPDGTQSLIDGLFGVGV